MLSGKSRHAVQLVRAIPPPRIYVATAEALDHEVRARVAEHQARCAEWRTIEAPLALSAMLAEVPNDAAVLVDCLTLSLSNLMFADMLIGPVVLADCGVFLVARNPMQVK